ncbi:MAG: PEP-CTERM sorting domain-containing protein [Planctomycetota bacterium]
MRHTHVVGVAICLLVVGAAALADDVFPPDWRGNYGTMTAGWGFWGGEGLGPRVLLQSEAQLIQANPGGFADPFPAWAYINSQVYVHDQLGNRQSVLEINDGGTLAFRLSNYDQDNPQKHLKLQITFRQSMGAPMTFDVGAWTGDPGDPPWNYPNTVAAVVDESFDHGDGWQTNSYHIWFEPNPLYEGFGINFTAYPAFVDQVVIDTWCIPEPATLSLVVLAIGGSALLRRR